MVFLLNVAGDVLGRKRNLCLQFQSRPPLHELARAAQSLFTVLLRTEAVPPGYSLPSPDLQPYLEFLVDLMVYYDEQELVWVELVSGAQLRTGSQVYCFQPIRHECAPIVVAARSPARGGITPPGNSAPRTSPPLAASDHRVSAAVASSGTVPSRSTLMRTSWKGQAVPAKGTASTALSSPYSPLVSAATNTVVITTTSEHLRDMDAPGFIPPPEMEVVWSADGAHPRALQHYRDLWMSHPRQRSQRAPLITVTGGLGALSAPHRPPPETDAAVYFDEPLRTSTRHVPATVRCAVPDLVTTPSPPQHSAPPQGRSPHPYDGDSDEAKESTVQAGEHTQMPADGTVPSGVAKPASTDAPSPHDVPDGLHQDSATGKEEAAVTTARHVPPPPRFRSAADDYGFSEKLRVVFDAMDHEQRSFLLLRDVFDFADSTLAPYRAREGVLCARSEETMVQTATSAEWRRRVFPLPMEGEECEAVAAGPLLTSSFSLPDALQAACGLTLEDVVRLADVDKDGRVNYREWMGLCLRHPDILDLFFLHWQRVCAGLAIARDTGSPRSSCRCHRLTPSPNATGGSWEDVHIRLHQRYPTGHCRWRCEACREIDAQLRAMGIGLIEES